MPQIKKTIPANVMKLLDVFSYGGSKVVIRRWHNCYEYLLIHHGELFCDYVQYGKVGKPAKEEDSKGIIDYLRSAAIETIDYHNQRSIKHKLLKLCENGISFPAKKPAKLRKKQVTTPVDSPSTAQETATLKPQA